MNFETFSMLLWDIAEPTAFVIIIYLLYKVYREIELLNEYFYGKEARQSAFMLVEKLMEKRMDTLKEEAEKKGMSLTEYLEKLMAEKLKDKKES